MCDFALVALPSLSIKWAQSHLPRWAGVTSEGLSPDDQTVAQEKDSINVYDDTAETHRAWGGGNSMGGYPQGPEQNWKSGWM